MKCSKYIFGDPEVEYLGHIVSEEQVDPKKVEAMQDWPHLKALKGLEGLLRLTCYNIKFVKIMEKLQFLIRI